MQKVHKVIISLVIICLVSLLMPFSISAAEEQTYYTVDDGIINARYSTSGYGYGYVEVRNSACRLTFVIYGNSVNQLAVCPSSLSGTYRYSTNYEGTNPTWTSYAAINSYSFEGTTYYLTSSVSIGNTNPSVWGVHINPTVYTDNLYKNAIYYTFGAGAVDPAPSFNYGDLVVGFHTNFSATGTTNDYTITNNTNLDTIEWENVDSNGNDLSNKGINVEIRAVPILYSANSKSALDLLGFQDAVVDSNNGLILWQGNFNDNHKSFIWNDVIRQLQTSNPAFAITSLLTGSVWTRYGWIYQIRYNDVLNGYSSDWQTIYNSTSIKVSDSEHIVNQYYYHYPSGVGSDDQDIFHDINTVNNTTNNWYVNDVPVDPDASWLDSLIQAIAEILGKILDFFSSIFDGLVDLLLGLFGDVNPADSFFNWFSDLFNGIGDIDLTLPQFNIPSADLSSFNRLVQETMDIFSLNNFGFVIFIPLLLIIIKAVF